MPVASSEKPDLAANGAAVTDLLRRSSSGDRGAESELIGLIYADLRRVAHREFGKRGASATGQATAVVHDLYLRFLRESPQTWPSRRHFFGAFARAVHDHLVDQIRRRASRGRNETLPSDLPVPQSDLDDSEIPALRDCLGRLDAVQPRAAEVIRNHYLLGLTIPENAEALGIGHATVERDLLFARAWLHERLRP